MKNLALLNPHHEPAKHARWSKMVVITGLPGNRSDFVAGWLANSGCGKFLDLAWHIRPLWNKSYIEPIWTWTKLDLLTLLCHCDLKYLDAIGPADTPSASEMLNQAIDHQFDASAPWVVTKSHISSWILHKIIPPPHLSKFIFVDILVSDRNSRLQVEWESFLKNVLFPADQDHRQGTNHVCPTLELFDLVPSGDLINDVKNIYDRVQHWMQTVTDHTQISPTMMQLSNKSAEYPAADVLSLDYHEIMTVDGCDALIDRFELPVDYARRLWQTSLPLTVSADRVWALEQWWTKFDLGQGT